MNALSAQADHKREESVAILGEVQGKEVQMSERRRRRMMMMPMQSK